MKPLRIIVLLLLAGICSMAGDPEQAGPKPAAGQLQFTPKYNIEGNGNSDNSPEHSTVTRRGKNVSYTFNTAGYTHCFEGTYVDDHTVEGIQARRSRRDGTTTLMRVTLVQKSDDLIEADWEVLDSNSDMAKGQRGTAISKRVIVRDE